MIVVCYITDFLYFCSKVLRVFTIFPNYEEVAKNSRYDSIEELKLLINTECKYEIMKQAFLFSCLCGLRISDLRKLKWNDLQKSGDRIRIEIKMQKTKEPLYLPISDEALKWLPLRGEAIDSDLIFPLTHEGTINKTLQQWAKAAGVTKHISFHTSRHTHATMMLTLGADLYTVSKLLGHKISQLPKYMQGL